MTFDIGPAQNDVKHEVHAKIGDKEKASNPGPDLCPGRKIAATTYQYSSFHLDLPKDRHRWQSGNTADLGA